MNRILIDGSYIAYANIFSTYSAVFNNQQFGPNFTPTDNEDFCEKLSEKYFGNLEYITRTIKESLQNTDTNSQECEAILVLDCKKTTNHRLRIFPDYKKQRIDATPPFNIGAAFNFLRHNFIQSGRMKAMLDIDWLSVDQAEGDDIIAVLVHSFPTDNNIIIAKDKDFVQLTDSARLFDHRLNEMTTQSIMEKHNINVSITPSQYLTLKIILGDGADNIPQVKKGLGFKRAINLITDKTAMDTFLAESPPDVLERIRLNRELIDMTRIPDDIKLNVLKSYLTLKKTNAEVNTL